MLRFSQGRRRYEREGVRVERQASTQAQRKNRRADALARLHRRSGAIDPTCAIGRADKHSQTRLKVTRSNPCGVGGDERAIIQNEYIIGMSLGARRDCEFGPG